MAQVQGVFYGESRIFGYPLIDLANVPPNVPTTPTQGGAPLQFTNEGDWLLYGHSAVTCNSALGGLPDRTPINLQVVRQDTGAQLVRVGQQAQVPSQNVQRGAPLEHLAGKAGDPAYMSYSLELPGGTRLTPQVTHEAAATPTGRSPLYIVAHALLRKPAGPKIEIGSKEAQQQVYRGEYTYFTGRLNYSAASPLPINAGDVITLPINTTQYFFIDSLWCRAKNAELGPNDPLNCLIHEDEILCSLKDTSSVSPFTVPGFVPLWTVFGNVAARFFHPPTLFVVRPRGSLEIQIKNGPTAPLEYGLEFTVGGVLVDRDQLPAVIAEAL
jgi:hypothetical protein